MSQKGLNLTEEIILQSVFKKFESGKWAVSDINLVVKPGEFFCFVGPSGSGKSTLLRLIANLIQPDRGKVDRPEPLAMVFQSGGLLPWMSVIDNVSLVCSRSKAEQYLEMMGLKSFLKKLPRELSGGQRQRVGIARALAVEPKLLLLDEPFSALDAVTTGELHEDLLKIWREMQPTIVMVSHSLEEAVILADRIGVVKQGQLKDVLEVNLPRPRDIAQPAYQALVDKLGQKLAD